MKRLSLTIPVIATAVAITAAPGTEAKSTAPIATAASVCGSSAKLPTHIHGVLTVATGSTSSSPFFVDNDPSNGEGFESAVVYAVAQKLGYTPAQVEWVVRPLSAALAAGKKNFDFDINEIPIPTAGPTQVAFSTAYYTDPQALVVSKSGQFRDVKSLSQLANNAVIGVPLDTNSLQAVTDLIDPLQQAGPYDSSADIAQAYTAGDVNAIVTDLGSAVSIVQTELPKTEVIGQFSYPGDEQWGLALQKHSPLTKCVDRALGALKGDGTLAKLAKKWIVTAGKIPVLKP